MAKKKPKKPKEDRSDRFVDNGLNFITLTRSDANNPEKAPAKDAPTKSK